MLVELNAIALSGVRPGNQARRTVGIRMTLLLIERLFWHCGDHTAKAGIGLIRPIPYDHNLLFSVARGPATGNPKWGFRENDGRATARGGLPCRFRLDLGGSRAAAYTFRVPILLEPALGLAKNSHQSRAREAAKHTHVWWRWQARATRVSGASPRRRSSRHGPGAFDRSRARLRAFPSCLESAWDRDRHQHQHPRAELPSQY